METNETYEEAKARRRQRTIVLVIAGVALCCVCLVVAIAIYSWSAVRGGQPEIPGAPFAPLAGESASAASLLIANARELIEPG